jgi:hypothetical protein
MLALHSLTVFIASRLPQPQRAVIRISSSRASARVSITGAQAMLSQASKTWSTPPSCLPAGVSIHSATAHTAMTIEMVISAIAAYMAASRFVLFMFPCLVSEVNGFPQAIRGIPVSAGTGVRKINFEPPGHLRRCRLF